MQASRRILAVTGAVAALAANAVVGTAHAQDAQAVTQAAEALRQAMLAADRAKLEALAADQLSYGHSAGVIETKAQFIDVIASRRTIYREMNLTAQTVAVVNDSAIVRHRFEGSVEVEGRTNPVRIGVLQVWQKQGGTWKLLARQAHAVPAA